MLSFKVSKFDNNKNSKEFNDNNSKKPNLIIFIKVKIIELLARSLNNSILLERLNIFLLASKSLLYNKRVDFKK